MRHLLFYLTVSCLTLNAQWTLLDSHSKASLRGIHNVGGGIAWASGTAGTILRTTNNGETWQTCAVPPGAEKLDFRGIHAFDATTAVIMSSGKGDQSRIYKTTDACQSWQLVFSNPDKDGFWDGLQFSGPQQGALIGDPVDGRFPIFLTEDAGNTWRQPNAKGIAAQKNQSLFAASNTSMLLAGGNIIFVTGGGENALIEADPQLANPPISVRPDLAAGAAAGGFSIATRTDGSNLIIVVVGGDYKLPAQTAGTAVTCIDNRHGSISCKAAETFPTGYRSAVAYDDKTKIWIAAGPNGTDVSTDDGRNWRPANAAEGTTPVAMPNWNAISLPFAVGGNGRIGKFQAPLTTQTAAQPSPPVMTLTIPGFPDGGQIPVKFSQAAPGVAPGEGMSPAITWANAPAGTQSFFLNMHDLDLARNKTTDDQAHWVLWNIPATATGLPEGVPKGSQLPDGSYQISATGPMYRGPGAAANGPFHHYVFELYALDIKLDVKPSTDAFETRANVMKAIQGHILSKAVYGGLFRRPQ